MGKARASLIIYEPNRSIYENNSSILFFSIGDAKSRKLFIFFGMYFRDL